MGEFPRKMRRDLGGNLQPEPTIPIPEGWRRLAEQEKHQPAVRHRGIPLYKLPIALYMSIISNTTSTHRHTLYPAIRSMSR